jgi:hypothetical protein
MKKLFYNFFAVAISLGCICGMCSKTDDKPDNSNTGNNTADNGFPGENTAYTAALLQTHN